MYRQQIKYIAPALCTSLLGFKRGIESYDYNYRSKESYMYSSRIFYGFVGGALYLNPLLLIVIFIPKEIYRAEVYIRNLEKEKETDYYNEIF
jgi:hypothetical protein